MSDKIALTTNVTDQDNSYLAEIPIENGGDVHGIKRGTSSFNSDRVDRIDMDQHEKNVNFFPHCGDLHDTSNLVRLTQPKRKKSLAGSLGSRLVKWFEKWCFLISIKRNALCYHKTRVLMYHLSKNNKSFGWCNCA